ncbi:LOW QUALITY PROTEIN: probable G-protein coupled receptor 32 [Eulemur rufifrons]|uniref:LOW QUALITY PROTEIN: probable G-protein coupled receptor 32 n=1 Tax=Eulemur rufifrons TaxID=859984 RepID=UPI0037428AB8
MPRRTLTWGRSCSRKMSAAECQPENVGCIRQLTVAALAVCFVVGVLGNGLVLWMTLFRMARTVPTVWFFNLALADFSLSLSLPVAINHVASGKWLLKNALACKCYMAFLVLTFLTSIWLLVLISVDRCVSVLYPVWARNHRTAPRAVRLACGVWLLAAAMCAPHLIFRTTRTWKGCEHCYFEFTLGSESAQNRSAGLWGRQVAVIVPYFLLGFLVPLVIIGACAYLIRAKLRREGWVHARRPRRLLLVLVSAFFAFWFPFNMMLLVQMGRLMDPMEPHFPRMLLLLWATFSLGCFNSSLNPFLYVFIGRDFQEKFFQSLPSVLARAFGEEGFLSSCPRGEVPRG